MSILCSGWQESEQGRGEKAKAGTEGARGRVKTAWLTQRPFLSEGLTQHNPLLLILITLFLILLLTLQLAFNDNWCDTRLYQGVWQAWRRQTSAAQTSPHRQTGWQAYRLTASQNSQPMKENEDARWSSWHTELLQNYGSYYLSWKFQLINANLI